MRAIRFAAQQTESIERCVSIRENAARINIVAPERIAQEFNKILAVRKPIYGLGLLFTSGLLEHILPELCALRELRRLKDGSQRQLLPYPWVVDNLSCTSEDYGSDGQHCCTTLASHEQRISSRGLDGPSEAVSFWEAKWYPSSGACAAADSRMKFVIRWYR